MMRLIRRLTGLLVLAMAGALYMHKYPVTTPPDWSYQHMNGGYRVVVLMSRANSIWIETLDRVPVMGKNISWVAVGAR